MTDVTTGQTAQAFEQCKVEPDGIKVGIATDLMNVGSSATSIAAHAHIPENAAKCVVGKVKGTYEEPSAFEKMKGSLETAFRSARDAVSSAVPGNLAELKQGVSAESTAGLLRDRGQKVDMQISGMGMK